MKFTILSHAGLLVEHNGVQILVDPWLRGSCYWRSWWNFPAPDPSLYEGLQPDYIYITHFHWDHFQSPSLRLFSRDTPILVARFYNDRMIQDLHYLGFKNTTEIPHGGRFDLGMGLVLHSFQFGLLPDSAIVLTDGKTVLFDVNDCKLVGLPLKQVTGRFPKIDFVLRSHSSAHAIPYCIEGYERDFSELRQPKDYAEEFTNFALHVGARHAIPFASNHCFLHRETEKFNATVSSPEEVRRVFDDRVRELGLESDCSLMPPGSSWDDTQGFDKRTFDYDRKDEYIAELKRRHESLLRGYYDEEDQEALDAEALRKYFGIFFRSLPRVLSWWKPIRVKFSIREANDMSYWLLDFRFRRLDLADAITDADIEISVGAKIINDCTRINMFASLAPSKRLSIKLKDKSRIADVWYFMYVLEQFEYEVLPLRKNLRLRSVGVRLRRWREAVEFLKILVRYKVMGRQFRIADMYPPAPGFKRPIP